jgi:membrane protein DedA with SNARE-associated domain
MRHYRLTRVRPWLGDPPALSLQQPADGLAAYVGLFLILCLAGLGLPIPEEVPVITAGVLAHQQLVVWWLALASCMAGILVGDCILYWAGRRWGERVLAMPGVRHLFAGDRRETLAASYRRRGIAIVFAARHVPGLRAAAFLTAGIAGVPFRKFIAADGAAVVYGVPFSFGLAYFFADQVHRLMAEVHRVELWVGLVAVGAFACWVARALWRRNRRFLLGNETHGDSAV